MRGGTSSAKYNLERIGVGVSTEGARGHVEVTLTGVGNGRVGLG